MRFSRADRSRLAEWWFTVDHALLAAILVLMAAGLVLSLAASPAVALKKGLPMYTSSSGSSCSPSLAWPSCWRSRC